MNTRVTRSASIPCINSMKNKIERLSREWHGLRGWRKHSGHPRNPCHPRLNDVVFCVLFLILAAPQAHAKSAVAGDIIVLGSVERILPVRTATTGKSKNRR